MPCEVVNDVPTAALWQPRRTQVPPFVDGGLNRRPRFPNVYTQNLYPTDFVRKLIVRQIVARLKYKSPLSYDLGLVRYAMIPSTTIIVVAPISPCETRPMSSVPSRCRVWPMLIAESPTNRCSVVFATMDRNLNACARMAREDHRGHKKMPINDENTAVVTPRNTHTNTGISPSPGSAGRVYILATVMYTGAHAAMYATMEPKKVVLCHDSPFHRGAES